MRAASTPADAAAPSPLVSVVIDRRTFEEELRRAAGGDVHVDPNDDLASRRCHSFDGMPRLPGDVGRPSAPVQPTARRTSGMTCAANRRIVSVSG